MWILGELSLFFVLRARSALSHLVIVSSKLWECNIKTKSVGRVVWRQTGHVSAPRSDLNFSHSCSSESVRSHITHTLLCKLTNTTAAAAAAGGCSRTQRLQCWHGRAYLNQILQLLLWLCDGTRSRRDCELGMNKCELALTQNKRRSIRLLRVILKVLLISRVDVHDNHGKRPTGSRKLCINWASIKLRLCTFWIYALKQRDGCAENH